MNPMCREPCLRSLRDVGIDQHAVYKESLAPPRATLLSQPLAELASFAQA